MKEPAAYRPVSGWAVAALVVGGCSALAVVTRFAWVLPLLGVGLSIAALKDVARPGAAKAGRPLALAGLALAIGCGTQAVTAAAVSRWILGHRARAAATVWIEAVQAGRMAEAIAASAPTLLPAADPPAAANDRGAEDAVARLTTLPAVQAAAACAAGRVAVLDASPIGSEGDVWRVRMSLTGCGGADAAIKLVVAPRVVLSGVAAVERWMVLAVDLEQ